MERKDKRKELGLASLTLGIIGLFLSWVPLLGLVLPVLAVILGMISQRNTLSNVGLVVGLIGVGVNLFVMAIAFLVLSAAL